MDILFKKKPVEILKQINEKAYQVSFKNKVYFVRLFDSKKELINYVENLKYLKNCGVLLPKTIYIDKKPINDTVIDSVQSYFVVYVFVLIICTLLISIDNFGFETTFTASLACISNIGPGLGDVGPYGSYAGFSNFSKFILLHIGI